MRHHQRRLFVTPAASKSFYSSQRVQLFWETANGRGYYRQILAHTGQQDIRLFSQRGMQFWAVSPPG